MNPDLVKILATVGSGGTFAIIVLLLVFKFLRSKKQCNDGLRCVNIPEVREALKTNLLTGEASSRLEGKIDDLKEDSTVQTTHLKIISTQSEKQTELLQRLVNKK